MTVAVGAGSRGLTAASSCSGGTIAALRRLGAEPFVVPAMGSHGGATADGQQAMLAALGVTAESVGAEIRSTMDTVIVARDRAGRPIHLDTHAAGADRILPVNRVKPHTAFHGPIESGCTKMAVVGFGKQPGAAHFHASGAGEMRARLADGIDALRGRLLGGVASVEGPTGEVVTVRALDRRRARRQRRAGAHRAGQGVGAEAAVRRDRRARHRARRQGHLRNDARSRTSPGVSGSPGSTTHRHRRCR